MIQYCTSGPERVPEFLNIEHENEIYHPVLHHTGLETVLRHDHPAWHAPPPHIDDFYHIILYKSGTGRFHFNDHLVEFGAGTLVLSHPGLNHHFYARQLRDDFAYHEVTLSWESKTGGKLCIPFADLLSRYSGETISLSSQVTCLASPLRAQLELEFKGLMSELRSGNRRWYRIFWRLATILHVLIEEAGHGSVDTEKAFPPRLMQTRRYMEREFNHCLPISSLAARTGMSEGHFLRAFKAAFGCSPLAYQQDLRIRIACRLLAGGEFRIAEVARRVGYDNPYYFSRVFRKCTGLAPREYRRK